MRDFWKSEDHSRPRWRREAITLILVAGLFTFFALIEDGPLVANLVERGPFIWCTVAIVGASICIRLGRPHRAGDSRHCAKCEYEVAPGGPPSEICPECGTVWSSPGSIVTGRKTRNPSLVLCGVGLAVVAMAPLVLALFRRLDFRDIGVHVTPTSTIIAAIAKPGEFVSDDLLREVCARQLSSEQAIALATALLDKRRSDGYLPLPGPPNWLETYVLSGVAPDEIVRRYFGEAFDIRLEAPDPVVVGADVPIDFIAKRRDARSTNEFYLVIERIVAADETLNDLVSEWLRGKYYLPTFHWCPAKSGTRTMTTVYYVICAPRLPMPVRVARREDGTLTMPPQAVAWRRFEIERTTG